MKFRIFLADDFFPFRTRHSSKIFSTCFLIICCAFNAFAAGADVQQADTADLKQLIKQADKLARKGNWTAAENILRRTIARFPQESKAKLKLAYVLIKQRRLIDAYDLSFEVAKAEPKNAYAFAVLGMTLLNAGNFNEAKISLVNAIQLEREEALAWAALGLLDYYENRIDESLANLRNAVYLEPNEPNYLFALAQVSARAENYKEAAEAYRRFLDVSPDTDSERRDRIKGLISFLRFLGNKYSLYQLEGEKQTTVPLTLVRDRPVIKLRINKHEEPLSFVLDTGSGISVISEKTAQKLKIKPVTRGGLARGFGGDGKFEIVYGFVKSVHIGDVSVRNVPVYIREFHSSNEKIDGYIGLSLISKFLTTIDYGNSSFSLTAVNPTEDNNLRVDKPSLPLRLTSGGFLSGEVQIEGVVSSLNFIVDTGASLSVISDELASTTEISRFVKNERIRVVGSAGETESVPMFLLPRVTFGSHSRSSITAIALDLDLINEASGFEQAGILGGNFLKNYRLTFDFQNSRVIFEPVKK